MKNLVTLFEIILSNCPLLGVGIGGSCFFLCTWILTGMPILTCFYSLEYFLTWREFTKIPSSELHKHFFPKAKCQKLMYIVMKSIFCLVLVQIHKQRGIFTDSWIKRKWQMLKVTRDLKTSKNCKFFFLYSQWQLPDST